MILERYLVLKGRYRIAEAQTVVQLLSLNCTFSLMKVGKKKSTKPKNPLLLEKKEFFQASFHSSSNHLGRILLKQTCFGHMSIFNVKNMFWIFLFGWF